MSWRVLVTAIAAALMIFFGLTVHAQETKKAVHAELSPDGVQRIDVVGGEYFFQPGHIIVKVNVPVELSIRKEPSMVPHNIVISAPDAGMEVREDIGKDSVTLKFTPTTVGTYPFFCDKRFLFFKSHREKGMEGILEVVP